MDFSQQNGKYCDMRDISCLMPSRRRVLQALCLVMMIMLYIYIKNYEDFETMYFRHTGNNAPCVIPKIDPFDSKMMEYIWNPGPLKCDDPAIIYIDQNNNLKFNITALKLQNETATNVACDITLFKRIQDYGIEFESPFPWKPSVNISRDFFRANCTGSNGVLYDGLLTRIEKKFDNFENMNDAIKDDKYSVILFGIDSLSRSSAIRQLPNMYQYLTTTLGGYDFKGYMKVADNTFVNMVPLLTGKFAHTDEIPIKHYYSDWFDNLTYIWKDFSIQKCPTFMAEDYPRFNMFNMGRKGFSVPPTDHYMRPFWKAKEMVMKNPFLEPYWSLLLNPNSNVTLNSSSGLCTADKPNHVVVMDYIKQFLTTYKNNRKFAFSFLTEFTHDYQNVMQLFDNDLTNFFKQLSSGGFLKDSILIVFSDHGLRFGNVQHLHVARIETRMPFLSIVIPETIKRKYPDVVRSLRINQERLSTAFDVHATLRDVAQGNIKKPGRFSIKGHLRGISLFRDLPENRSCSDASITEEFCACYKTTSLDVDNNPLGNKIATAAVNHINRILSTNKLCSQLKLDKVIELNRIEQGLKHYKTARSRFFWLSKNLTEVEVRADTRHSVVIETLPGNGRFYVTCDVYGEDNIKVYDNVDRLNRYGNQSSCVDEHKLKHICNCNNLR